MLPGFCVGQPMTDIQFATSRFDISRVLARGFGVARDNIVAFGALGALLIMAPSAFSAFLMAGTETTSSSFFNPADRIIGLTFGLLATGSITHLAFHAMRSRKVSFVDSLKSGFTLWPAMFGISWLRNLGLLVGLVLLIVPGLFLLVAWSVAVPARLADGPGVPASLSRSFKLTEGSRWKIFALVLIVALIFVVLAGASGIGLAFLGDLEQPLGDYFIFPLLELLLSLMLCVGSTSIFQELILMKEGGGVEPTASVFD